MKDNNKSRNEFINRLKHSIKKASQKIRKYNFIKVEYSRSLQPKDVSYGYGRGTPIDRYYIERFLMENIACIKGDVLEIGDNSYTMKYGGDKVKTSEILHVDRSNSNATIFADLSRGESIASNSFDCLIITQTLHLIYNFHSAIKTMHRILKPGGVALVSFPGISQMADEVWNKSWYWGFTRHSAKRMFGEVFLSESVEVSAFGNVLTSTSFLRGIATEELTKKQLSFRDSAYDLVICVKAVKLDSSFS